MTELLPAMAVPAVCTPNLAQLLAYLFELHARLAQHARGALGEDAPRLRPWGAWEFSLTDIEGNRLIFVQWVVSSVFEPHCR